MPPNPPANHAIVNCLALAETEAQANTHARRNALSTGAILDFNFQILDCCNPASLGYPLNTQAHEMQDESIKLHEPSGTKSVTELETEIAALKRELAELKQEKVDLEILLETIAEHSDSIEAELHKAAITALRQSEEMFRTIAEATPVPILVSRLNDGTVLYANAAAIATFGILPQETLSQNTLDFYHDSSDRQKLLDAMECDGYVQNFELQCRRVNGSLFWASASLRQLVFNDEPAFLTALCDITQRKLEEEALKRQVQELQIEIDHAKCERQVAEIVQSEYFQQLKEEVDRLRCGDDFEL